MLGTRTDAEDVVQDTYLRWHQSATNHIQSPVAFLVAITTCLCLDRLREPSYSADSTWTHGCPNRWSRDPSPRRRFSASSLMTSRLRFLQCWNALTQKRAQRSCCKKIFDYDYREVAHITHKSESPCREMIHRARVRLRQARRRFSVTKQPCEGLLQKFLIAAQSRDGNAVIALLSENVEYFSGGGGKMAAALEFCTGRKALAGVPLHPPPISWPQYVFISSRPAYKSAKLASSRCIGGRALRIVRSHCIGL